MPVLIVVNPLPPLFFVFLFYLVWYSPPIFTRARQVANLADDLQNEQASHQAARVALEARTKELEEQAERLATLEQESASIHRQNYELSVRMEEMNRVAEEREREAEERESARKDADDGGGGGEGEGGLADKAVVEELEKVKTVLELKNRQLEAVQSRVCVSVCV